MIVKNIAKKINDLSSPTWRISLQLLSLLQMFFPVDSHPVSIELFSPLSEADLPYPEARSAEPVYNLSSLGLHCLIVFYLGWSSTGGSVSWKTDNGKYTAGGKFHMSAGIGGKTFILFCYFFPLFPFSPFPLFPFPLSLFSFSFFVVDDWKRVYTSLATELFPSAGLRSTRRVPRR